ncbi:MAG: hypothetical protein PHS80_00070 [Methanothrix sp.]|nr:hypothetical protein [Methanothrix sp.]
MNQETLSKALESHLRELGGPGSGRKASGPGSANPKDKRLNRLKRIRAGPTPRIRRVKALDNGEEFDIEEYEDEEAES